MLFTNFGYIISHGRTSLLHSGNGIRVKWMLFAWLVTVNHMDQTCIELNVSELPLVTFKTS